MILESERRSETNEAQLARNVLATCHLPLVGYLVDRAASALPSHVDREDLQSAGVMGLMSAAERFDPSRQVQFKTFAARRIVGAILDELRAQDWAPRRIREKLSF